MDNSINIYWIYKFTVFRDRDDTTEKVWGLKRVICKFRDLYDTVKQVWGPKRAIWEFRDLDDTDEQVWGFELSICKSKDRDDTAKQVRGPPVHFTLIEMIRHYVMCSMAFDVLGSTEEFCGGNKYLWTLMAKRARYERLHIICKNHLSMLLSIW